MLPIYMHLDVIFDTSDVDVRCAVFRFYWNIQIALSLSFRLLLNWYAIIHSKLYCLTVQWSGVAVECRETGQDKK